MSILALIYVQYTTSHEADYFGEYVAAAERIARENGAGVYGGSERF